MTEFTSIRPNIAIQSAYGKAGDLQGGPDALAEAADGSKSQSFGDMLRNAASHSVQTVRTGDEVATAGLTGQAGIQQVVEATMTMESTVRVSVAVRDKIVEAYQEVMRMPI